MSGTFEHGPPDEATVAAYLSNRLEPTRADAFEMYCLSHPEFARRVELDLLFRVGLRQTHGQGRILRTGQRRRMRLAIAASIALVVCCGWLLLPQLHSGALLVYRSSSEVPPALFAGPRVSVTLIRVRGSSTIHRIVAPQRAGVLAVRVAPDSPPGPRGYVVELALESAVTPRSVAVDNLYLDARGYIQMYVPLAEVIGRTFKVTVNPSPAMSTGSESLSFRLQVVDSDKVPTNSP